MRQLASDLRDAARALCRRPAFALLAVITLAVGMSVNTVAFSVVNAVLFKQPSFADADRLGWIFIGTKGNPLGEASWPDYQIFRERSATLDGVIAEGRLPLRLREGSRSEQIWSLVVSPSYFSVLGVSAEVGRLLTIADASHPVAVVSHGFWRARLGGGAPGRSTLLLNEQPFTVVGVLPPGFQGPGGLYSPDVWVSLDARDVLGLQPDLLAPSNDWLTLIGRAKPGIDPRQVSAELTRLARREGGSSEEDRRTARFAPMADGHPEARMLGPAAAIGMGVVAIVLLIACFNVAGLLLTRATERRREMAVRAALGASGWRLVRQLLAEALVLASAAGTLALAFSAGSGPLLSSFSLPAPIPQRIDLSPDWRSALFTVALVLVAAVLPALLPARHATRLDLQQVLASDSASTMGGARGSASRRAFQVLQIAGSTMFLALAALFVTSFHGMMTADPGFETRRALVVTAYPRSHGRNAQEAEQMFRALAQRLRTDGRVRQAAVAASIPYTVGAPRATKVGVSGQDCRTQRCETADLFAVEPGYLEAMRIPLVNGRDLRESDGRVGGAVLVSRTAAERLWPGRNPIGEQVTLANGSELAEVVGVVGDVGASGFGRKPGAQLYRVIRTADFGDIVTLVVGTRGEPSALVERVRGTASSVGGSLPLQSVHTMTEHLALPLWPGRVAAWFLGVCGVVALLLASVGLFGVISYAVAQRTSEFGVRMALGASPRRILTMVLGEGAGLTLAGSLLGLAAGAGAAMLVRFALVGVSALSPGPYLAAAGIQAAIALLACSGPARRAAKVDPITVIRTR